MNEIAETNHNKPPDKQEDNQPDAASTGQEAKIEHESPGISVEDSKIDQLAAGASADEARIDQLIAVNRELAVFLEEQFDAVLSVRKSVTAMHGFIESDPTLKKKYDKYLKGAERDAAEDTDIQKTVRMRGTFSRLQRFGTL